MATKKVIPIKPLTSWSFSRYSDWRACPLKAKLKHIDKISEPPNAAMQRGNDIHHMAENYVKGTLPKLPKELALFKQDFADLRKRYKAKKEPMIVEDQWAFTKTWEETRWNDWAGCWVRIKLDVAHYEGNVLYKTDWKTGKYSDYKVAEYNEQLELYALASLLMSRREDVVVHPRIGWLDEGFYTSPTDKAGNELSYTKDDQSRLMKEWNKRVTPMMSDTRFAPKPNATCKWCFYGQAGKAKGGPGICQY